MVQSFNTLGIWWFRRHVPHVLRGQLSSNLTADHLPEPWILTFVVKHLLGNVLGRPDFISYKLADLPMFEVWFFKHILHLPVAVWTLRTPDALKKENGIMICRYSRKRTLTINFVKNVNIP